ncbi:MAG: DUF998 domain-containing protein [Nanoarchaeota archaeon]|nr:DUF998 domain-containing protein [Nanoarchaeota archaeon]
MQEYLIQIMRLSGILSTILIPIGLATSIRKFRNFNFVKNPLSNCGKRKESSMIFNLTLAVFGILQFMFAYAILTHYSLTDSLIIILPLAISAFLTVSASVITEKVNLRAHRIIGFLIFVILLLWALMLHIHIYMIEPIVGSISLVISFFMISGTAILYKKYWISSIPEIYFIGLVMIWNFFFSYVILA